MRVDKTAGLAIGSSSMQFILGVIIGVAPTLGGAYVHDTGMVNAGPKQPFVNWSTVKTLWPR
jgi:hypothetical protein